MANMHKHPVRGLRGIDDALWTDFDTATSTVGADRSSTLKAYMEWYVRREGATLPERPPAE
ncbi:hypothetical protein [Streptomyces sp. NBC_00236]|uniref:hypothetical protein n=1 Tax=Streptomyces sp. NBC_00236 TaxID=2903639 RepID=UPI002E2CCD27|nr:hypothetical protein [Streptomyces sp. NBC_00236]